MARVNVQLAVVNGRLVTPSGVRPGVVLVADGRILRIADSAPGHVPVLDAAGRYVLPGLIDSHVHFRTPVWSTRRTGNTAAAPRSPVV